MGRTIARRLLGERGKMTQKRVLIFGASGGIGAAMAQQAGTEGAEVVALSRSQTGLELTDPASIEAALEGQGVFDAVVIATGILAPKDTTPEKALAALTPDTMAQVFAVNAIGPALILARIAPHLPRNRRAVVAVLSARVGSISDNRLGGWHSYRASKAALNQILRGAAIEMHRTRPQTTCVALHPGTVKTALTSGYGGYDKLTPQEAAQRLWHVMDGLTSAQSGSFLDFNGLHVPW